MGGSLVLKDRSARESINRVGIGSPQKLSHYPQTSFFRSRLAVRPHFSSYKKSEVGLLACPFCPAIHQLVELSFLGAVKRFHFTSPNRNHISARL